MYCTCKYSKMDGYTHIADDLWGHSICKQPTIQVFDRLTNMRVPYNAKALLSEHGHSDGIHILRFALEDGSKVEMAYYHPYPFKDSLVTEQRDVLLKFWIDLDGCINRINQPYIDPLYDQAADKVRARTYCEMLAYLMHRFYEDGNAVGHEAMARYQARQDGIHNHQTPGLAEALWSADTRHDGTLYSAASEGAVRAGKRPTATSVKTGNRIPDGAVGSWQKGISEGMFTTSQAAKTYNMSEAEVKEQLGIA